MKQQWYKSSSYQLICFDKATLFEGSANIFNHVNGSRNHLDSLLESGKLVETLESGIIISTYIFGYLHKNESHDAQALIW